MAHIKLRRARMGAGLTQTEFSEMIGLTFHCYQQKEVGKRSITIAEAVRMAKALNMSLDDLFMDE